MLYAHAGHWTTQLIYIAPLLFVLGMVGYSKWRDRHATATPVDQDDPSHAETTGDDR